MSPLSLRLRIHSVRKPEFQLDGSKQDVVFKRFIKRGKQNFARLIEHNFGRKHQLKRWLAVSALYFADSVSAYAEKLAEIFLRQATA